MNGPRHVTPSFWREADESPEDMDEWLTVSPGSSEPDSPGGLNRGCLFDPGDFLSIIVPETPSPRLRKRRRQRCNTDQLITPVTGGGAQRRAEQAYSAERVSPSGPKQRRLAAPVPAAAPTGGGEEEEQREEEQREAGLDSASSLRTFPENAVAPSSVSRPSSSSSSLTRVSEDTEEAEPRKRKRRRMSSSSSSSSPRSDALSFLTEEERRWLNGEGGDAGPRGTPRVGSVDVDQIIISDDDEAVVRVAQMEEDEAFARSLQAEFDQEEAQNQRQQNQHQQNQYRQTLHQQNQFQQSQSPREQSPSRFYSGVQPRWMSQVLAAVTPPAGLEEESAGQRRGRGRSRRRNALPDLSEDSQGNDYEALLEFEERQGAVKSKLTRREIQRFPTKTFVSTNTGGNTQCQICFCDYAAGDKQRMLSCFHDYHVQCIDRWLKDNTTCPICRANMGRPLTSG